MITIKFWLIVAFLPLCYNNNVVAPNLAIERGCLRGFTYLISCFHRSWYSQLLYLQMARWRRQRQLACGCSTVQKEKNTYELALVGVRFCAYALISFLSCRYYNIFKQLFQVFPTSIYSIVVCKIYLDRGSCRSAAGEFTYKCIPIKKK